VREAFDVLDDLAIDWFVTGSEAAACYGVLRQTFDTDVVIDMKPPARRWFSMRVVSLLPSATEIIARLGLATA